MRLAVAGGTGAVGAPVVAEARRRGHEVVVLARSCGVDLVTGVGLDGVLEDVHAVVDVTSTSTRSARESEAFFGGVTGRLLDVGRRAGVRHHVALSIVGIDRAPHGYYAGKVLQERTVVESGTGWTILRATQFHEFVPQILGQVGLGPLLLVPRMRCQPVAAVEVAHRLVDLAELGPGGRAPDLAGPREESLVSLARAYEQATGGRRRVLGLRLPGKLGRAMRDGTLLPAAGGDLGDETFETWLARTR